MLRALSPRQRHLADLLARGACAPDARALLRLRGRPDDGAVRAALGALAERHEALGGSADALPVPETEDLRGPGGGARVEALWSAAPAAEDALPAARLLRVADDEHLLLLRLPPLAADETSFGHLARELAALLAGGALPEPVPYAEVAEWLEEVAESPEAQTGRAFWLSQAEGSDAPLPLERDAPGDAPAPVRRVLPASLRSPEDATLLAAWAALLLRLGAAGGPLGVAVDGRAGEGLGDAVGPFTQHLPLALGAAAEEPFRALARRAERALESAAAWQECFDAATVRRLRPAAPAPRAALTVAPRRAAHACGGVEVSVERARAPEDPFALHLRVEREDGGAALELRAGPTVSAEQAAWTLERFEALLADALARPEAPVGELAVLGPGERARVLDGWSRTASRSGPRERTVVGLFGERAALAPDAPAIVRGAETLSFAELDRRAGARARRLRALGVGPEVRVGIMLPVSAERVETVLAVLRAGGAWVPLDPGYPEDRLAFVVRDAGVRLVLTRSALRDRVPAVEGVRVVAWEEEPDAADGLPDAGPEPDPRSAAYVIYTSGSTGTPKGVLVEHGALAAHSRSVVEHYGLGPGDRVLQFASFSFDASVEQTLPPLLAGACVVLRDEAVLDAAGLGRLVAGSGVTLLNLPTAQWHLLADEWARGEGAPERHAVRLVIAGGEAMLPRYAALWRETPAAGAGLLNAYGPTETVVTACVFEVPPGFGAGGERRVPIGRPLGGRAAYVLDGRGEPVPAGVPGELCLGGEPVARGYLGRPEPTAERFVPDPFGGAPGARLYRTGDLARRRDDGTLEFLGRADRQVKVRGFRIEPGEVEAALDRHPRVRQSAVAVEEPAEGETRLVAYWVGAEPGAVEEPELRAWLRGRLPEHMVPGLFAELEAMPLTAVGKVDRARLPAQKRLAGERPYVAPRTATEEAVAELWGRVMRRERVSMDDEFFALGGHSLLATQLASRLRRRFGIELAVAQVFEARDVAALARVVEEAAAAPRGEQAPPAPIARSSREGRSVRAADLASLLDE